MKNNSSTNPILVDLFTGLMTSILSLSGCIFTLMLIFYLIDVNYFLVSETNRSLNGMQTTWYNNGIKKIERHVKDGLKDGKLKLKGNYLRGYAIDKTEGWYETGERRTLITYSKSGVSNKAEEWHTNGNRKSIENFDIIITNANPIKPNTLHKTIFIEKISSFSKSQTLHNSSFKEKRISSLQWNKNGKAIKPINLNIQKWINVFQNHPLNNRNKIDLESF